MTMTFLLVSMLAMASSGSPGLGEPFSLRVGESLRIEGAELGLRFTEVARDSRCPKDASCIVAGEARVVIEAELEAESAKILFRVPPGGGDSREFERFTLTVTALEPQTESARRIDAADYLATIVVTAAESP